MIYSYHPGQLKLNYLPGQLKLSIGDMIKLKINLHTLNLQKDDMLKVIAIRPTQDGKIYYCLEDSPQSVKLKPKFPIIALIVYESEFEVINTHSKEPFYRFMDVNS